MKLLNKTTLFYFSLFTTVLVTSMVVLAISLQFLIRNDVDRTLQQEKIVITEQLHRLDSIPAFSIYGDHEFEIRTFFSDKDTLDVYSGVQLFDRFEGMEIPYRQLRFVVGCEQETYEVIIRKSLLPARNLTKSITITGVLMLLLLGLGAVFLNRWTSARLWRPFYKTLDRLGRFELEKGKTESFPGEDIEEFDRLNQALNEMTQRIYRDYRSQKQFIENFSHEIQTPLAVIRANLEMAFQEQYLNDKTATIFQALYDASDRLTRINKALILLSKIENRQFTPETRVDLAAIIAEVIQNVEESLAMKDIDFTYDQKARPFIKLNRDLGVILVQNLLQNLVRHTPKGGKASVVITANSLLVSNTSEGTPLQEEILFSRFVHGNSHHRSIGIGLAIAKEICEFNGMKIEYRHQENQHVFEVFF